MKFLEKLKVGIFGHKPPVNKRPIEDVSQRVSNIESELKTIADTARDLGRDVADKSNQASTLDTKLNKMKQEDAVLTDALQVKTTTLTKIVNTAISGDRWRGRIEGAIIGFLTGLTSSLLVWFLTKYIQERMKQ